MARTVISIISITNTPPNSLIGGKIYYLARGIKGSFLTVAIFRFARPA